MADEKRQEDADRNEWRQRSAKAFDQVMKQILDLGQSSLSGSQFQAFRKMAMDYFADGKRSLFGIERGRCGESKIMAEKVGAYE